MERIEFAAGNEKRFAEFMSNLDDGKLALISHNDMDGVTAAKVANSVLDANILKFVGYDHLTVELAKELKKEKVKKIVFTDLFLNEALVNELEKFAHVLIIDHHMIGKDFNSNKTIFMNAQGYCASYICYYLFSQMRNLDKIDWLVAGASVADFLYFKNAAWMKEVYDKYGERYIPDMKGIKEGKKIWDIQLKISLALVYFRENVRKVYDLIGEKFGEIGKLEKCAGIVQEDIDDKLRRFDKEKIAFKNGYYFEFVPEYPVGSIVSTILSEKYLNKTIFIARENKDLFNFSARRQDGKEDMNALLKKLTEGLKNADGGGHFKASGGHCMLKDKEEIKKRLLAL